MVNRGHLNRDLKAGRGKHDNGCWKFSLVAQSCLNLCDLMDYSMPGLAVHRQLPEFTQTHVHWVSDAIQPSHLLSSSSPPAFNLSQHQGLFQWVSSSYIRWPKYWSFSFNISPSNDHSRLISFRMGWLDLLAVQRDSQESSPTPQLKSINSSALNFLHSPLSHPYMTTGKTIALTRRTFVGKVMSLLFNMLSNLVITFLSKSKRL